MIIGQVNHRIEVLIPIEVRNGDQALSVKAMIDTGFSGYLLLSPFEIMSLQLPFLETRTYSLGNNAEVDFDIYQGTVVWHGQDRDVLVLSAEGHPLAGMSLLKGSRLFIDAVDGGEVRVDARS